MSTAYGARCDRSTRGDIRASLRIVQTRNAAGCGQIPVCAACHAVPLLTTPHGFFRRHSLLRSRPARGVYNDLGLSAANQRRGWRELTRRPKPAHQPHIGPHPTAPPSTLTTNSGSSLPERAGLSSNKFRTVRPFMCSSAASHRVTAAERRTSVLGWTPWPPRVQPDPHRIIPVGRGSPVAPKNRSPRGISKPARTSRLGFWYSVHTPQDRRCCFVT